MRLFHIFKRRAPIRMAPLQEKQLNNVVSAVVYSDRVFRPKTNYFVYLDGRVSTLNQDTDKHGNMLIGLQTSLDTLWHNATQTNQLMQLVKMLRQERNLLYITPADRQIRTNLSVLLKKNPDIKGVLFMECRMK